MERFTITLPEDIKIDYDYLDELYKEKNFHICGYNNIKSKFKLPKLPRIPNFLEDKPLDIVTNHFINNEKIVKYLSRTYFREKFLKDPRTHFQEKAFIIKQIENMYFDGNIINYNYLENIPETIQELLFMFLKLNIKYIPNKYLEKYKYTDKDLYEYLYFYYITYLFVSENLYEDKFVEAYNNISNMEEILELIYYIILDTLKNNKDKGQYIHYIKNKDLLDEIILYNKNNWLRTLDINLVKKIDKLMEYIDKYEDIQPTSTLYILYSNLTDDKYEDLFRGSVSKYEKIHNLVNMDNINYILDIYLEYIKLFENKELIPESNLFKMMILPKTITPGLYENYFHNNITQYVPYLLNINEYKDYNIENLMDNPDFDIEILYTYSDNELFNMFELNIDYDSRLSLISKLGLLLRQPGFFQTTNKNYSINKETLSFTNINEEFNMVNYGLPRNYHTYDLDDLILAFSTSDNNMVVFRNPQNNNMSFTVPEIYSLKKLLTYIFDNNDPEYINLITNINIGLRQHYKVDEYDQNLRTICASFSNGDRENIIKVFEDLFNVAMYMRRWLGPGTPYPIKENQTRNLGDINGISESTYVLENSSNHLNEFINYMDSLPQHITDFIYDLNILEFKNNKFTRIILKFSFILNDVAMGNYCIRMASSKFIGTSIYYLNLLFGRTIEGFNIKDLDRIV